MHSVIVLLLNTANILYTLVNLNLEIKKFNSFHQGQLMK